MGTDGKGIKSRLLPIGRWLMRRMVWMMGVPFDVMEKVNEGTVGSLVFQMAKEEEWIRTQGDVAMDEDVEGGGGLHMMFHDDTSDEDSE